MFYDREKSMILMEKPSSSFRICNTQKSNIDIIRLIIVIFSQTIQLSVKNRFCYHKCRTFKAEGLKVSKVLKLDGLLRIKNKMMTKKEV